MSNSNALVQKLWNYCNILRDDGLAGKHGEYEIVLANPPFGKKSSVTIVNEAGESSRESLTINRDDFWATTSNKQRNFLQHIFTILKQHGRAAVVLPDNVLFEGGAGESISRELLKQADVHKLPGLPRLTGGEGHSQGQSTPEMVKTDQPGNEQTRAKHVVLRGSADGFADTNYPVGTRTPTDSARNCCATNYTTE